MPPARFVLLLLAVLLFAAVTVLMLMALPSQLRPWLVPVLLIAAVGVRALGRGKG